MNITDKIEHIADWTSENISRKTNKINQESGEFDFEKIEKLIDEKLPTDFIQIYKKFNGEKGNSDGILFGLEFLTTKMIITELEFSLTLVKPKERKVINKTKSEHILNEISSLYFMSITNNDKKEIFSREWKKANFKCSSGSYSGISVELENGKIESYRLNKGFSKRLLELTKEIHSIEKENYNWDSLEFEIIPNGTYKVERKDYIWEEEIDFSSCPKESIRKRYFHYKWLPIFSDYGGNFIGFDLDPDKNGTKEQIIIYGRDEEKMVVLADNLNDFLDLTIKEMEENSNQFLTETHIYEIFKRIKNCA